MIQKLLKRQEVRFLMVGVLNTIVGYGIYAILLFFQMNYLIANTISTILGVLHSYLWNRFYTFKSKEKAINEFVKFVSVYALSYFIGTCTLIVFKNFLHLNPYFAGLFNLGVTTVISFFGHKNFSFHQSSINVSEIWKKSQKYLIPVGLFLTSFMALMLFRTTFDFVDEGDVMLGALTVARGGHIYLDFASQHMPGTYWIFAFFAFFGVHSVEGFRISMYVLLAFLFTFIYCRYYKKVGKLPLLVYPFVYLFFMSYTSGTGVLSEQIQSQCLVILFLELFSFWKEKKLSLSSQILIPTVIVLSILCAFVSIIPCFLAVIAFLFLDVRFAKAKSVKEYFSRFWKKYRLLLGVGIGLVLLFFFVLILNGSLGEWYQQAIYLNTSVYSKYNGYSSNPFLTMILIVPNYLRSIELHLNLNSFLFLAMSVGIWVYFIKIWKKDKFFAILSLYFILLCGNRGFGGFHALPFYAVMIVSSLYAIQDLNKVFVRISLLLFVLLFGYTNKTYFLEYTKPYDNEQSYYQDIDKMAQSDLLFRIDTNTPGYLHAEKMPGSRFNGMVPWFAEVYEEELLEDIQEALPNILFYDPYGEVWGYVYKDFVPNINQFIFSNYLYNIDYHVWIRKDYFDDAEELLDKDFAEYSNAYGKANPFVLSNNLIEQTITPKEDVDGVSILFGTYQRENYSHLVFDFYEDEESIYHQEIVANELQDNEWFLLPVSLKKGHQYRLSITSKYTNSTDYVAIYKMKDDFQFDDNELSINGAEYQEDLLLQMYYE